MYKATIQYSQFDNNTVFHGHVSPCRFNWLFVKRFWLILRVAIPRVCSKSLLLLFALIMARAAGSNRLMLILIIKYIIALVFCNNSTFVVMFVV